MDDTRTRFSLEYIHQILNFIKVCCLGSLICGSMVLSGCGGGEGNGGGGGTPPTISSVTVTCNPSSVRTGETSQCAAKVTGTGNYSSAVTWSAKGGSITSGGVFTSTSAGTSTVIATSAQDVTRSGSAAIAVNPLPAPTSPLIVPSILVAGQQAQVTITCYISDADSGTQVQLFTLANGAAVLIGNMVDTGQDGDVTAGDQIYTVVAQLTPSMASTLPLQVVATEGTTTSQNADFSVPLINIPSFTTDNEVNQAESQLYDTAIQTRTSFSTPDWSSSTLLPTMSGNLAFIYRQFSGVVNQNAGLQSSVAAPKKIASAHSQTKSPRRPGITNSILDVLTSGLLSPAQNANSCNQLLQSLGGFRSNATVPVLSLNDPELQQFGQELATICTTAASCQGAFSVSDFLGANLAAAEWAQEYVVSGQPLLTPIAGCGGGVAQTLGEVAVKTAASQFTDLSGESLTELAGGGQIAQQVSDIPTDILTGWVVGNGQNTLVIAQANGTETFAAPAGTYNLAVSAGGSEPNATVTAPVYPNGVTNFSTLPLGGTIIFLPPNITNISPSSGPVGTPVYITGSNIGTPYDQVAFNGTTATILSALDGQIEAVVPTAATSGPITVDSVGGVATSPMSFTVTSGVYGNPTPTITSLNPTSAKAGTQSLSLAVTGTGFLSNSDVTISGNGRAVTFVSASQLLVQLTASDLSTPGTYPVVVTNPAPGGGASLAVSFVVTNSQPVNLWTWMSGSKLAGSSGSYGSLGVPSTSNAPRARTGATGWTDPGGNLWLFGGTELTNSQGVGAFLNDLWEYSPAANTWKWVSGSATDSYMGVYGTQGVPSTTNVPGARETSSSWIDGNGNLWLFGGLGTNVNSWGWFNDLWEFNPTSNSWAWISGSNTINQLGSYGSKGTASPSNVPGARFNSVTWIDGSGNLWLFGGQVLDSTGNGEDFNDLWEYSPANKVWTWVSGSNVANQTGVYGTEGVPSTTNTPGARELAVSWTDTAGNLWLFGGLCLSGSCSVDDMNDLWEFSPAAKTWTWVSGSTTSNQTGVYGTKGIAESGNVPGGRDSAVSWIDSNGNFWLFGGEGIDSTGYTGYLNDLWEFSPSGKTWTWVNGSNVGWGSGLYGSEGVASSSNVAGSRANAVGWRDSNGNLWLFGGQGLDSSSTTNAGVLNDLWRYQP